MIVDVVEVVDVVHAADVRRTEMRRGLQAVTRIQCGSGSGPVRKAVRTDARSHQVQLGDS